MLPLGLSISALVRVRAPLATEASVVMSDPLFGFALPRRNDHGVGRVEFFDPLFGATFLGKPLWIWLIGIVFTLLAFDLGVLHRDQHEIGARESLWLAAGYVAIAAVFGGWV